MKSEISLLSIGLGVTASLVIRMMMLGGRSWWWSAGVLAALLTLMPTMALAQNRPPPCESDIYCHGELLKTVQLAHIYNDSKYFVDMTLKFPPSQVTGAFETLMNNTKNNPSQTQVKTFVEENFYDPGKEFETWTPGDWNSNPEFLNKVQDPELEEWAKNLNELWKKLGRKISQEVKQEPERYSQIFVPNPVIVPGGRFREFYYWDSYWTIDGLLLSGMTETVKGMLENFLKMVDKYGMVPNGGRIYYTRRSQPPYLIPMVKLYMDHTNDLDFLGENIELLEKEFKFWEDQRSLEIKDRDGKAHRVAQYRADVGEPRPESYR
nr:trehalase-like isoform X1 [Cherax quadricarinatus]